MKFKLFFVYFILLLSLLLPGYAAKSSVPAPNVDRYRASLSIALEYTSIDLSMHNRIPEWNSPVTLRQEAYYSSNSHHSCRKLQVSPGIEFGLKILNDYYLGVMINYHYTRVSTGIKNPLPSDFYLEHEFKLKSSTDALLKFGYSPLRKVMFYGLVGPSFAEWGHDTRTVQNSDDIYKVRRYSVFKKKTVGLSFGAGIEYLIRGKYALNFIYTTTMHRAQSVNYQTLYNGENMVAPIFSERILNPEKKLRLSYSTIGLRFSYFFSL